LFETKAWYKEKQKNYATCNMQLHIFFENELCFFFTPTYFYYFVHESIKIQFPKN